MHDSGRGAIHPDDAHRASWIRRADDEGGGIERIEAFFDGVGYAMHRHDTYAIGLTLSGVQSFHYQGALRHSLAGGALVLHPDEKHDGQAGAEGGFRYRMIYVEPAAIQAILRGKPLPFVAGGLCGDVRLLAAVRRLLAEMDRPLDPLDRDDALYDLALALDAVADGPSTGRPGIVDHRAAEMARAFLHSRPAKVDLATLEQLVGRDRWSLSRDFRALFGVSPYRYLTFRRLDAAKQAMLAGRSLADAALASGFSDQSHMTRRFTAAYGLPPARWLRLQRS